MTVIKKSLESPRYDDKGVLHWYQGDTFSLTFVIKNVDINPTDAIQVIFSNALNNKIKVFNFTNIEENIVIVVIDRLTSNLFKVGQYTYNIKLFKDDITTIVAEDKIEVE